MDELLKALNWRSFKQALVNGKMWQDKSLTCTLAHEWKIFLGSPRLLARLNAQHGFTGIAKTFCTTSFWAANYVFKKTYFTLNRKLARTTTYLTRHLQEKQQATCQVFFLHVIRQSRHVKLLGQQKMHHYYEKPVVCLLDEQSNFKWIPGLLDSCSHCCIFTTFWWNIPCWLLLDS